MKKLFVLFLFISLQITVYGQSFRNTTQVAKDIYTTRDFISAVDLIKNRFIDLKCKVIDISVIKWETHKEYYELLDDPIFFITPILGRDYILENVTKQLFTVWVTAYYFENNSFIMTIIWFTDNNENGNIHQAIYVIPS